MTCTTTSDTPYCALLCPSVVPKKAMTQTVYISPESSTILMTRLSLSGFDEDDMTRDRTCHNFQIIAAV